MGDAPRQYSRPERLQVRRHERVQRGTDVYNGRGDLLRPVRPAGRLLRHGLYIHHLLHNYHPLPCFCAKGRLPLCMYAVNVTAVYIILFIVH